ncbi:hypothetical protein SASPL_128860 [Salvia splendens]|uniref:40S ribosomal protein S25 n=1 Tax=Salvia splendens TaxID=180675 RepID=A0A8X8XG31_SALSN|nr:hypothetical protein SASPL_128860 [Salvia splendens]
MFKDIFSNTIVYCRWRPKKDKAPPPSSQAGEIRRRKAEEEGRLLLSGARISGSLARKAIRELMARGLIRMVSAHASQQIYTRATNT